MNLEKKKNFIINSVYFILWISFCYLIFKVAAVYIMPFIIGLIIACLVQKPAEFISTRSILKKQICAAVLSVFFYIVVALLAGLMIWFLSLQCIRLLRNVISSNIINSFLENVFSFSSRFFDRISNNFGETIKKVTYDTANDFIYKLSGFLSDAATSLIKRFPDMIISFTITIVATCYISKDFDKLKKFISGIISKNFYTKFIDFKNIFLNCILKFSFGYLLLFLITFCELLIGFIVLDIQNCLIIAFVISFVDLLPVFGTGVVLLPWAAAGFLQNDYKIGLGMTMIYVIIVIVRNFSEPKIIGKQMGLNPIFTLFFIFLGLRIGGITGMIIFPIVFTVIFTYYRQQVKNENV